jgi:hypothetical protein
MHPDLRGSIHADSVAASGSAVVAISVPASVLRIMGAGYSGKTPGIGGRLPTG